MSQCAQQDKQEILRLYERMRRCKAKLVGPDGHAVNLPDSLYAFLCRVLADLLEGKSVSIVQSQAELTTVEASHMLGVSRQFLVNLLEKGELPYHKIGTHRRVYVKDLLAYKAKRDGVRRKILDDLVQAELDEKLYDMMPPESTDAAADLLALTNHYVVVIDVAIWFPCQSAIPCSDWLRSRHFTFRNGRSKFWKKSSAH